MAAGELIQLPLRPILEKLPDNLKARLGGNLPSHGSVSFPKQKVLSQLASGSVKVSYEELRQGVPSGSLPSAADLNQTSIELPLSTILETLGPQALTRRTDQKRIVIPDEVAGVFGSQGQRITPPKSTVIGVAPVERPAEKKPTLAPLPAPAAKAAPTPAPTQPSAPAARPAMPSPAPKPAEPKPASASPIQVSSNLLQQMAAAAGATAPKPAAPAPAPVAATPVAAKPTVPSGPPGMIAVPAGSVSGGWPDAIRQEIAQLKLADGNLLIPTEEMGRGLKFGKVAFAWKQLLQWTEPSLADSTKQGETTVDLPLKIVAPLYLAQHRQAPPKRKVVIDSSIPDMFAGKGEGGVAAPVAPPAAVAAPTPAAPRPTAAPAPAAAPAVVPAVAAQTFGSIFGEPGKIAWTPQEIAQRTARLEGVAGALIASEDGLSVAAQLPPVLKAETVAGFVPQIFNRMLQYARDLGAGEIGELKFTAGLVPWQIIKCGAVYLAVVGRGSSALPEAKIKTIASEIARINRRS